MVLSNRLLITYEGHELPRPSSDPDRRRVGVTYYTATSEPAGVFIDGDELVRLVGRLGAKAAHTSPRCCGASLTDGQPGSPAAADEGVPYRQLQDGLRRITMSWVLLTVAGLLEVGWASILPATHGLTLPVPTALFVALLAASMIALAIATRTIPVATAYAVWVGIGAAGAATIGMLWRGDPATPLRILCLTLLVVAIIGLKLTGNHGAT